MTEWANAMIHNTCGGFLCFGGTLFCTWKHYSHLYTKWHKWQIVLSWIQSKKGLWSRPKKWCKQLSCLGQTTLQTILLVFNVVCRINNKKVTMENLWSRSNLRIAVQVILEKGHIICSEELYNFWKWVLMFYWTLVRWVPGNESSDDYYVRDTHHEWDFNRYTKPWGNNCFWNLYKEVHPSSKKKRSQITWDS